MDPPYGPPATLVGRFVLGLTLLPLASERIGEDVTVSFSSATSTSAPLGTYPSGFPLRETTRALSPSANPATRTTVPFGMIILVRSFLVTRIVSRVSL